MRHLWSLLRGTISTRGSPFSRVEVWWICGPNFGRKLAGYMQWTNWQHRPQGGGFKDVFFNSDRLGNHRIWLINLENMGFQELKPVPFLFQIHHFFGGSGVQRLVFREWSQDHPFFRPWVFMCMPIIRAFLWRERLKFKTWKAPKWHQTNWCDNKTIQKLKW